MPPIFGGSYDNLKIILDLIRLNKYNIVYTLCIIYYKIYSSIAQSVEHAAVNRRVVGSSPT